MKNKLLATIILLCALPVHALQIHTATDDSQIKANISAVETSRITLVGDRIKQFFINQGRIVVEKDETKGDLYITPTEFFSDKDVNLFITSEQGKTFSLLLEPTEMPSATVAIKSTDQNNKVAKTWETGNPYEVSLIKLIQAMAKGEKPKGYQTSSLGFRLSVLEKLEKPLLNQVALNNAVLYEGSHFQGYVLTVQNKSKESIQFKTSDFKHLNALAIAIESPKLYPNLTTKIFVVISNG